jgi:hypothetical protein
LISELGNRYDGFGFIRESGRASGRESDRESACGQMIKQCESRAGAGLERGLTGLGYRTWWASVKEPGNPHYAEAATEALMPGVVPGLVGMLLVRTTKNMI